MASLDLTPLTITLITDNGTSLVLVGKDAHNCILNYELIQTIYELSKETKNIDIKIPTSLKIFMVLNNICAFNKSMVTVDDVPKLVTLMDYLGSDYKITRSIRKSFGLIDLMKPETKKLKQDHITFRSIVESTPSSDTKTLDAQDESLLLDVQKWEEAIKLYNDQASLYVRLAQNTGRVGATRRGLGIVKTGVTGDDNHHNVVKDRIPTICDTINKNTLDIFKNIKSGKCIIAGGSIVRNIYMKFPVNAIYDYDVFIISEDAIVRKNIIDEIFENIKSLGLKTTIVESIFATTILTNDLTNVLNLKIQIIKINYKSVSDVLSHFDLDACSICIDSSTGKIYALPRCLRALVTMTNIYDLEILQHDRNVCSINVYESRIKKYMNIGFAIAFPQMDDREDFFNMTNSVFTRMCKKSPSIENTYETLGQRPDNKEIDNVGSDIPITHDIYLCPYIEVVNIPPPPQVKSQPEFDAEYAMVQLLNTIKNPK
jgi:hypothetical protein